MQKFYFKSYYCLIRNAMSLLKCYKLYFYIYFILISFLGLLFFDDNGINIYILYIVAVIATLLLGIILSVFIIVFRMSKTTSFSSHIENSILFIEGDSKKYFFKKEDIVKAIFVSKELEDELHLLLSPESSEKFGLKGRQNTFRLYLSKLKNKKIQEEFLLSISDFLGKESVSREKHPVKKINSFQITLCLMFTLFTLIVLT